MQKGDRHRLLGPASGAPSIPTAGRLESAGSLPPKADIYCTLQRWLSTVDQVGSLSQQMMLCGGAAAIGKCLAKALSFCRYVTTNFNTVIA